MRILLITTGLKVGGAEHQVMTLARAFLAHGHAVAILSLSPGREIDVPAGAHVVELNMRKTPMGMARALWKARSLVRSWRPDVIHAHMVHANLFARVLTRAVSCPPLVCTAHSSREGGWPIILAYRMTDRWARLNTHVSHDGRNSMIRAGAMRAAHTIVVPNGIDTTRFRIDPDARRTTRNALGIAPDTRFLLNVGRLVPFKAQDLLIEAFGQYRAGSGAMDAVLMIAGGGPLRERLQQQVSQANLDAHVKLLGPRVDIPALLNAADGFVLSSDVEGLPLVVAEAMATGCPVVATKAPGVIEVVGSLGTIVPCQDASSLAKAIENLLSTGRGSTDDQAARRQRVVAMFAVESVAQQWLEVYLQLCRRPAAAFERIH